jgi:two-component system, OmpR family, alkaline phosphatase synthesis response regulator PhoP
MSAIKPLIVVQEDAPQIARIIQFKLSMEGFDVALTEEGEQTFAAVEKRPASLLVLDAETPGLTGWEVLRRLRSRGEGVPVILLLENEAQDRVAEAMSAGASDCVVKPFRPTQLAKKVSALLGVRSQPAA